MKVKLFFLLIIFGLVLPMVANADDCGRRCSRIKSRWNTFLNVAQVPGVPLPPPAPTIPWPFAGTVLATFPCPCNLGIAVMILPVHGSAGPYFIPFAAMKSYYAAIPGNMIMGGAIPGGVCLSVLICLPLPVAFTVLPIVPPGVGTTLLPPIIQQLSPI